jgi:orotate phosphoribosyltransferase
VLLADDVRNTGQTLARAARVVRDAGGTLLGAVVICDRMEPIVGLDAPLVALVEYQAPENFPANVCPLCAAGMPITSF